MTMIITGDDPGEEADCRGKGCSNIVRPADCDKFIHIARKLGFFLSVVSGA